MKKQFMILALIASLFLGSNINTNSFNSSWKPFLGLFVLSTSSLITGYIFFNNNTNGNETKKTLFTSKFKKNTLYAIGGIALLASLYAFKERQNYLNRPFKIRDKENYWTNNPSN